MEETKLPGGDAVDDGDENGGEERGDVDDEDLFSERPRKQKQEGDAEAEKDMPADGAARGDLSGSGVQGRGGQRGLLRLLRL